MKSLVALCFLALVTLSYGVPMIYPRGCIYIMGTCVEECEVGTTAYLADCGPLTPEPTCDEPNPVPESGTICDYSACYCDAPTVRDTVSGKCVAIENCPKKD